MPEWDPNIYLRFEQYRTQPAMDLVNRIPLENPGRTIDLGCGPGNSTAILRDRWPDAQITGLDSSEDMLIQARERDIDVTWTQADMAAWSPDSPFDIIFANASLQWLPDHGTVFSKLISHVASGGVLAVQLPFHHASPLQQVVLEASRDARWTDKMEGARNALTYATAGFYYDTLSARCEKIDLWETEYFHIMESHQDIVDFIRGSGLRPFTEALESDEDIQQFESLVLHGYSRAYPRQSDGRILFPFRRQFILAHR